MYDAQRTGESSEETLSNLYGGTVVVRSTPRGLENGAVVPAYNPLRKEKEPVASTANASTVLGSRVSICGTGEVMYVKFPDM
jgi:hypothetical protein